MSNHAKRNPPATVVSPRQFWRLGTVLLLGGLLIGLIVGIPWRRKGDVKSSRNPIGVMVTTPAYSEQDPLWPLVREIAELFICGCMKCGNMNLADCDCKMSNGGVAEKLFIRDKLVAGLSKEAIIDRVEQKYGQRVAHTQNPPTLEEIAEIEALNASP